MGKRNLALQLAAAAGCDPRTAARALAGYHVRTESVRERLEAAAKKLGIKLPERKETT